MKNPIKWYKSLWPVDRHYAKNAYIAIAVLLVTIVVLVLMFFLPSDDYVRGNWAYIIQGAAVALGGALVGCVYWARAMRGKK